MSASPWSRDVGAATAAAAAAYMARAQAEAAKRQAVDYARLSSILSGGRITAAPEKCKCCGSHEFARHNGRMICVFCRVVVTA